MSMIVIHFQILTTKLPKNGICWRFDQVSRDFALKKTIERIEKAPELDTISYRKAYRIILWEKVFEKQ